MSDELNFEESFKRLDAILERMNSGKASLDESLKLYEEADKLIHGCTTRLSQAEEKIEILIKNRQGGVDLDEEGEKPLTQAFQP